MQYLVKKSTVCSLQSAVCSLQSANVRHRLHPGEKVCVTGGHVTSRNQGLSPNDKGRQRRESLGTRLVTRPAVTHAMVSM